MKITIIAVFYNCKIEESKTFTSLKNLFNKSEYLRNYELILYDNSLERQQFNSLNYKGINVSYIHDDRNMGICSAYNYALSKARINNSEWMLLLDHDTVLTDEFIDEIMNLPPMEKGIAAVVPIILDGDTRISPVSSGNLRPLKGSKPNTGIQDNPVMAINSGSLIRISFLNEVGGFNTEFPLDYLDHWLFYEVYNRNYKTFVLNTRLKHDLSVMDYTTISFARYQSILESEIKFYNNYRKDILRSYRIHLAKRFLKQIFLVKNKKIARLTLRRLLSLKG
jgi:GT2 family glycosyltransferase